ncbi:hypothetical protein MES5069_340025 [Mesorhizobium escarrei]|uniref:Uncharacterized protein n=1 Tax=Mesorhizobium escarrei TaxID=666018 RepID=A0ABM9E0S7_9HYPH|nr:hypothetical protein MES5069_340025 [Mesorhizobium escarrei]
MVLTRTDRHPALWLIAQLVSKVLGEKEPKPRSLFALEGGRLSI